jgi:magnesium transporter
MLVNCAAYMDGEKLGDIPPSEISDHVSRPECFLMGRRAVPAFS